MILGRVAGSVVSTVQHPGTAGRTLLLVEKLDAAGRAEGGYLLAIDAIGAGNGETVLVLDEGNGARQILGSAAAPVRSLVVGIVDDLHLASR